MWGQDAMTLDDLDDEGIIPTRVGTSTERLPKGAENQDHPHACGDKFDYVYTTVYTIGSSPRVWGQEKSVTLTANLPGIIPTRVGTRQV